MSEEKNTKKGMTPVLKFICMILCVLIAWVVFSGKGFLPRAVSFPVNPEKQKYSNMFKVTGYSFEYSLINLDQPTVPAGTFHSMHIFENNNLTNYQKIYYDEYNNKFFLGTSMKIASFDMNKEKHKLLKEHLEQERSAVVKYENMLISFTGSGEYFQLTNIDGTRDETLKISTDGIKYSHTFENEYDSSTGKYVNTEKKEYNYARMAAILKKNETEKISLREFASILAVTNSFLLGGWYPEENLAVFRHGDGKVQYVIHYNVESQAIEEYGPFPVYDGKERYMYKPGWFVVWEEKEEKDVISLYNYRTGEEIIVAEAPRLISFVFRIKPSGNIAFAGVMDQEYISEWVYDGDSNIGQKYNTGVKSMNQPISIALGKDSILTAITDNNHQLQWYYSHVDYMEDG